MKGWKRTGKLAEENTAVEKELHPWLDIFAIVSSDIHGGGEEAIELYKSTGMLQKIVPR